MPCSIYDTQSAGHASIYTTQGSQPSAPPFQASGSQACIYSSMNGSQDRQPSIYETQAPRSEPSTGELVSEVDTAPHAEGQAPAMRAPRAASIPSVIPHRIPHQVQQGTNQYAINETQANSFSHRRRSAPASLRSVSFDLQPTNIPAAKQDDEADATSPWGGEGGGAPARKFGTFRT